MRSLQKMQILRFCFFCQPLSSFSRLAGRFFVLGGIQRCLLVCRGSADRGGRPVARTPPATPPPHPRGPPTPAHAARFAAAQRRLGPSSSASISTTVRLSPSWVSQERICSRPVTTTRVPRVRVSALFSARLRQALTEKYDVSPSFQLPDSSL